MATNNPNSSQDGQKQAEQYKAAFDSLRDSITNIDKPLNDISRSINSLDRDITKFTDTVSKLNSQNQELGKSGNVVKDTIGNLSDSFSAWANVIKLVKDGISGLEGELTAGLSILTAFGPAILSWIVDMTKGNTTLTALGKTLKDVKIVMDAVNQTQLQGSQNAQAELVQLKLLYNATQDHNLALKERKKIANELKDQYPNAFSNINTEQILLGKAKNAYDELTKSILATSRARAAQDLIVNNQKRQLVNESKLAGLTADLKMYNDELAIAQKQYKDVVIIQQFGQEDNYTCSNQI